MSIQGILIFILFLGPLIFFHELGHFLFARLFGVRVETFSIGFGPKFLKFKRGFTEYAVSIIPLGGYVKMYGDDPLKRDEIPEELREVSYNFKNKWARFWIVMGGPLANFIMAFVIFSFLSMVGEKIPELRLGKISPTDQLYSLGFRTGDRLKKVNEKGIYNPSDVLGDGEGIVKTITVSRQDNLTNIPVNMDGKEFFDLMVNHPPILLAPIVVNKEGDSFLVSNKPSQKIEDFETSLEQLAEETTGNLYFYKIVNKDEVELKNIKFESFANIIPISYTNETFLKELRNIGYYSTDVTVQKVNLASAADKAGVKTGDILLKINNIEFFSFTNLKSNLQEAKGDKVTITLLRDSQEKMFEVTPELHRENGKVTKLIGVYSDARHLTPRFINTKPLGFFGSFTAGMRRTYDAVVKTIDGFIKLITGSVSFKNIGGPVTIGKVAQDSFNISLSYFFQIMAMISVNLGVINLFPIPILDGGHIMFLIFEAINGGPLSRRKMEIAQMVGLSIILLLMTGAIFNDFSRWF